MKTFSILIAVLLLNFCNILNAQVLSKTILDSIINQCEKTNSNVLLIYQKGKTIYSNYFGKPIEKIEAMSATKSVVSIAMGILLDKKFIDSLDQPVYNLLGGKTRECLKSYYTGNDPSALSEFGIRDMKIAIPYGPAHGEDGMRKNEEIVSKARETIGSNGFIALDIYMSWDVPYTLRMYDRLRDYGIAWLEEPVPPDNYEGYREIRRSVNTMVTGGEHEYTLEGFRRLIEGGCVDIVQPDIYRAGGPAGLKKIAALAKAHNLKLVCHGIGSPTYIS